MVAHHEGAGSVSFLDLILRSAHLRASRRMEGVPDLFLYLWPFTAQEPPAHFDVVETALAPALFAGITGEFCFAAPPTAIGFFGPPRAFCADAGCDGAKALRITTSAAFIMAPFFIDASLRVEFPGKVFSMAATLRASRHPAKKDHNNAITATAISPVPIQPSATSQGLALNRPISSKLVTTTIIIAMIGTATMPLSTALHTSM